MRTSELTCTITELNGGGNYEDVSISIPSNAIDIHRIAISTSESNTDSAFIICNSPSMLNNTIQYEINWSGATVIHPAPSGENNVQLSWLVPYEDFNNDNKLYIRVINNSSESLDYEISILYEYQQSSDSAIQGAPDGISASAYANGLKIVVGASAASNTYGIYEAELRAILLDAGEHGIPQDLRTSDEGGTFSHNGTTRLIITGIPATPSGAQYLWTSPGHGRWYYAMRLRNASGWSRWSDGNINPVYVTDWVRTQESGDTGPPEDWSLWIEQGSASSTIVVHATRPAINSSSLINWTVQVKDGSTGSWVDLDSNTYPSVLKYDGSATSHTVSSDGTVISKTSSGWGTAAAGDLVLMDVRGGAFDVNYCQWGTVETIESNQLVFTSAKWRPQAFSDVRIKIVKPPWEWSGAGYLGAETNRGMWSADIWGKYQSEYISDPIEIPSSVTNPEVRVWFENLYARSHDDTTASGISGGTGIFVGPASFSNFTDRSLWIPIYGPSTWGTITNQSSGAVILATGTTSYPFHGYVGVRSRFVIWPGSNGEFTVYAKFTNVTLPVGASADNLLGLGIILTKGYATTTSTFGAAVIIKGTDASQVCFNAPYLITKRWSVANALYYPGNVNLSRPANGSTIEMKAYFKKYTSADYYGIYPIQISVNEGTWTTKSPTWYDLGAGKQLQPSEVFIGWVGNCKLTGATATLERFELINGIGEYV